MDSVRWIRVGLSTRLGSKTRQPVSPKEGSSLQKPGGERLNQIYVEGRLGRVKKMSVNRLCPIDSSRVVGG